MGLALVSAGMYAAAVTKWVDYARTQLDFESPGSEYVSAVNVSDLPGGGKSIMIRWTFENTGGLPITIANFQFQFAVDNGSDARMWDDPGKLADEFGEPLSFQADRFTGPVVPPAGVTEWTWWANATAPGDVARVLPHADDGRYYFAFFSIRFVYYISDVNNRRVFSPDGFLLRVVP